MRTRTLLSLLVASLGLSGCSVSLSSQQPAATRWTTGFWFWHGSDEGPAPAHKAIDALFVQVGTIRSDAAWIVGSKRRESPVRWLADVELPDRLPAAREYWAVFRYERRAVPDAQAIPVLAQTLSKLQHAAAVRHLDVGGLQLDIDSPTGSLAEYASFLREVRRILPQGWRLSITALLDWFRSGTAVDEVVAATDEFVPQFYDVADPKSYDGPAAITMKIDAVRWGPIFNRFRKPFRVGISTFGRARLVENADALPSAYGRAVFLRGIAPLHLATNTAFKSESARNQSGELVLTYSALRPVTVGYSRFHPGDGVQFVFSTPEVVRRAVESAKRMGGRVAGVVFFRWPASEESLTMQPDEVLNAAGESVGGAAGRNRIRKVNGGCAAVDCMDLYMEGADPFCAYGTRYRIRSSGELEYFVPDRGMPVTMAGPAQLELSLPPYCARGLLYLGRAVSKDHVEFTVDREK